MTNNLNIYPRSDVDPIDAEYTAPSIQELGNLATATLGDDINGQADPLWGYAVPHKGLVENPGASFANIVEP